MASVTRISIANSLRIHTRLCSSTLFSKLSNITFHQSSSTSSSSLAKKPKLTLFSKSSGCSLCDDAKVVLADYKHLLDIEEVDISHKDNQSWYKLYRYDIPVLHLNGTFLMKHRVDVTVLQKAITDNTNSS